jgi:hypothetical protein
MLFQLINRIEGKQILPVRDNVNMAACSKSGWGSITFLQIMYPDVSTIMSLRHYDE